MISGEDRDEAPLVGEEVEIEAVEGQDEEDREDYEPEEADRNLLLEDDPLVNITKKSDIEWRHTPFTPVNTTWKSPAPAPEPPEPLTPYDYFKQYVPSEMLQLMTKMTNIYAEQNAAEEAKPEVKSETMKFVLQIRETAAQLQDGLDELSDIPKVEAYSL